jgi:hypothetical protein
MYEFESKALISIQVLFITWYELSLCLIFFSPSPNRHHFPFNEFCCFHRRRAVFPPRRTPFPPWEQGTRFFSPPGTAQDQSPSPLPDSFHRLWCSVRCHVMCGCGMWSEQENYMLDYSIRCFFVLFISPRFYSWIGRVGFSNMMSEPRSWVQYPPTTYFFATHISPSVAFFGPVDTTAPEREQTAPTTTAHT